jgi:hypothetical protein
MTSSLEGIRIGIRPISQRIIRQNQSKKQYDKVLYDVIRFTFLIAPASPQSTGVYLVPFSYQFSWLDTKAANMMNVCIKSNSFKNLIKACSSMKGPAD